MAACLIVFFQLCCLFLLVVHGVGFAEIRGHHAFVVAAAVLLLLLLLRLMLLVVMVVGWGWASVVPLVFPVVVFSGQMFMPSLFLLFFAVASLGSGYGGRSSRSLCLHLLLVQVVQVVADGVQGLGVQGKRTRGGWWRTAVVGLNGLLLLLLLA